jgi:hypothetical protein
MVCGTPTFRWVVKAVGACKLCSIEKATFLLVKKRQRDKINMDVEQLHIVLQQSFSADATVRKPSEDFIRNLKHIPGAVVSLLQVAAEHQVH